MAAYLPQRIFELAVTSVVKAHLESSLKVEDAAAHVWEGYAKTYVDDQVQIDLIFAANGALDKLKHMDEKDSAAFVLNYQYFAANFEHDGKKRKKWAPFGTVLDQRKKNPNRTKDFMLRLLVYMAGTKRGDVPTAPKGWSLSRG